MTGEISMIMSDNKQYNKYSNKYKNLKLAFLFFQFFYINYDGDTLSYI